MLLRVMHNAELNINGSNTTVSNSEFGNSKPLVLEMKLLSTKKTSDVIFIKLVKPYMNKRKLTLSKSYSLDDVSIEMQMHDTLSGSEKYCDSFLQKRKPFSPVAYKFRLNILLTPERGSD